MGLNAFFAFTVVLHMGYSWQMALTAVFLEGIIFIILSLANIREAIINSIPVSIKHAISAGIGLFIALIGFKNAGIIVSDPNTLVSIGKLSEHTVIIALTGVLVSSIFLVLKIKGALLYGIIASTLVALPLKAAVLPHGGIFRLPPSLNPIAFQFDFHYLLNPDFIVVLFTFLFVEIFDTVGTIIGVCGKANMLDKKGRVPRAKQALLSDALATTIGSILGTSTVTAYVESAAGVAEGGKTGLTAVTVAALFAVALFLSPLFLMVPQAATAPALIMVGFFMISPVTKVDLDNYSEAIPAFLTIILMPLTYSISEGIVFGILSYVAINLLTGKFSRLSITLIILALLFCIKLIFLG
jgi:AGZA family xanthine/uracil permease-like MFS transporter